MSSNIHGLSQLRQRDPVGNPQNSAPRPLGQRVRDALHGIPLVTTSIVIICFVLYFYGLISGTNLADSNANCPNLVVEGSQLYRLFTSTFVHLGFLHVFFNMLVVFMVCKDVEKAYGSLATIGQVSMFAVLSNLLYTLFYVIITAMTGDKTYMYQCAAGYSGNVFAFLWIMITLAEIPVLSFCGIFSMPAKAYPFFLLLLMSLLGNGVSFFGHLSGLMLGILYTFGLLNFITVPRFLLHKFEDSCVGLFLANHVHMYYPTRLDGQPDAMVNEQLSFTKATYADLLRSRVGRVIFSPCTACCGDPGERRTHTQPAASSAFASAGTGFTLGGGPSFGGGRVGGDNISSTTRPFSNSVSEEQSLSWGQRIASVFGAAPYSQLRDTGEPDIEQGPTHTRTQTQPEPPHETTASAPSVNRQGYSNFHDELDLHIAVDDHSINSTNGGGATYSTTAPAEDGENLFLTQNPTAGETSNTSANTQDTNTDHRKTRPGKPVSRLVQ